MGRLQLEVQHFAGTRARARAFRNAIIARVRTGFDRAIRADLERRGARKIDVVLSAEIVSSLRQLASGAPSPMPRHR